MSKLNRKILLFKFKIKLKQKKNEINYFINLNTDTLSQNLIKNNPKIKN